MVPANADTWGNRGTVTLHAFPPCGDAPNGGVTLTLDKVRPEVGAGQVYLSPSEAVALAHELLGCVRDLSPALSFSQMNAPARVQL